MTPKTKWAFLGLLVLFLCVALYQVNAVISYYPTRDEGVSLYGAVRIINGDIPYKEFFHLTTPGAIWSLAPAFRVFGENLVVARMLYLFFGLILFVTIFMTSLRLTKNPLLSLIPASLYFLLDICAFPNFTPHIPAISLAALGVFLLCDFKGPGSAALSGLAVSISFLMSQNIGAFTVLGSVVILAEAGWLKENPLKIIVVFLFSFSIPVIGLLVYLGIHGALNEFIYDCFIWTVTRYADFNAYPYLHSGMLGAGEAMRLIARGERIGFNIMVLGSLIAVGFLPIVLFPFFICTSYFQGEWRTWAASIGGLSIFISSSNRPDYFHLLHAMPFVLILSFSLIHSLAVDLARPGRKVLSIPLAVLVLPIAFWTIEGGLFLRDMASLNMKVLKTERGNVKMPSDEYAIRSKLFDYIKTHVPAGGDIYVIHWSPEIYFFTGRRNPTPFDLYKPIYYSQAQSEKILARLKKSKPQIVVHDDFIAGLFDPISKISLTYPFVDRPSLLTQDFVKPFILEHYAAREEFGSYTVYVRKEP